MEKVTGWLRISIDVECPHCKQCVDLTKINSLTDDGYIYKEVIEGKDALRCKYLDAKVNCPHCAEVFEVGEIFW